jgi:RNA polymerase sigma-70 factor, ECF subfamily
MTAQTWAIPAMVAAGDGGVDKAQRFRAAALPHLDDVYTLARYLLRNPADAEDAAQECYLRAFRHFETFRGGPIKPWLLAILRNVCRAEYARRGALAAVQTEGLDEAEQCAEGLWSEGSDSPEANALRRLDADVVQRLIAQLPDVFRETLVLREINGLSYREIADVVGTPVGTVMSRLARARALLRDAWMAEEKGP